MSDNRVRVVVTGMGAVTPLGSSVEQFWEGLVAGRSGVGPITLCDTSGIQPALQGRSRTLTRRSTSTPRRLAGWRVSASSPLPRPTWPWRIPAWIWDVRTRRGSGCCWATGQAALSTTQDACEDMNEKGAMKVNPFFIPMMLPNMAAANVARAGWGQGLQLNGGHSLRGLQTRPSARQQRPYAGGAVDIVLAGGSEASISKIGLSGFCILRALSTHNDEPEKASRPFDARRDGFVPAEGAAILILESLEHALNRGATILAELAGYGASSDAFHAVQPDETGEGAGRAMRWAMANAGITTDQVDYINAHGTSTPLNDAVETMAIKKVFGESAYTVPISSTKSMTGHALGGAGALEAVACIKNYPGRDHTPYGEPGKRRPRLRPGLCAQHRATPEGGHRPVQQLWIRRAEHLHRGAPFRGVAERPNVVVPAKLVLVETGSGHPSPRPALLDSCSGAGMTCPFIACPVLDTGGGGAEFHCPLVVSLSNHMSR